MTSTAMPNGVSRPRWMKRSSSVPVRIRTTSAPTATAAAQNAGFAMRAPCARELERAPAYQHEDRRHHHECGDIPPRAEQQTVPRRRPPHRELLSSGVERVVGADGDGEHRRGTGDVDGVEQAAHPIETSDRIGEHQVQEDRGAAGTRARAGPVPSTVRRRPSGTRRRTRRPRRPPAGSRPDRSGWPGVATPSPRRRPRRPRRRRRG